MSGKIGNVSVCSRSLSLYLRPLIRRHYPATEAQLVVQGHLAQIQGLWAEYPQWSDVADLQGSWAWLAAKRNTTPYHLWLKDNLKRENQDALLHATPMTPWTQAQGGPIVPVQDLTHIYVGPTRRNITWTSTNGAGYSLMLLCRALPRFFWYLPLGGTPEETAEFATIRGFLLATTHQLYAIPIRDADGRCGLSVQIEVELPP